MPRLRPGLALAALLGAATYLALGTGPFLRWLAAAALLLALLELRPWSLLAARPRLLRALPHLVLGVLVLALLGEFLLGRPPASRDHAIHYFQTELLVHDLLPAGHLSGWSDRLGQGYTLGDSYPVLGYLWMGAAHLLTLGLVPLRASYALGILAMWLLAISGVWRLAACITAEILPPNLSNAGQKLDSRSFTLESTSRPTEPETSTTLWPAWAGCLGAALWLLDIGASREGGWEYLMFHGVWPQLLATSLWISSLPVTLSALRTPSPRRIALAAGLLGLALLAHPFALLTAAGSAAAWAVLLVVRPSAPDLPRAGNWRVLLLVHALAAALAAGWLASFFASADTLGRSPVPWLSWGELATQLISGELFEAHRAWVGPLALLGLALALRRGAILAWLTAGLLLVTLVLASEAAITVLRLDLLVSAFKNIQFPRYAIVLKPLWYALAGVGAAILMLWTRRSWELQQSSTDGQFLHSDPSAPPKINPTHSQKFTPLARLAACIILAPILAGTLEDLGRLAPAPIGARHTLEASRWRSVEADLRAALAAERTTTDLPLRIAFLRTGMGGGTFPIFAIADEHADLVLDGHIPSLNSVHRIRGRSVALLRDLGVTHVLHDKPLPKREQPLADALTPVTKVGPYTLARLTPRPSGPDLTPDDPRALPGIATWTTRGLIVTPTRHDAHALDLDVSAATTLDLLAAPERKWHATFVPADAGDPIPLATPATALHAGDLTGTRLELPGPGRVELRYLDSPRERALAWLSLLTALALLAALAARRPLEFAERLASPTAVKISRLLTALTAALLLILAVRRQSLQLARTWQPLIASKAFAADLVDSGAYTVTMDPADTCDGLDGRDARHGCSAARDRPRRATLYRNPYLYRCLWVTVPPRGRTVVRFDAPAGTRVTGHVQRRTAGKQNKRLTLRTDKRAAVPIKDRQVSFSGPTVTLSNGGGGLEQLCLIAAAVE